MQSGTSCPVFKCTRRGGWTSEWSKSAHHDVRLDGNQMNAGVAGVRMLQLAQVLHALQGRCGLAVEQIGLGQQAQRLQGPFHGPLKVSML